MLKKFPFSRPSLLVSHRRTILRITDELRNAAEPRMHIRLRAGRRHHKSNGTERRGNGESRGLRGELRGAGAGCSALGATATVGGRGGSGLPAGEQRGRSGRWHNSAAAADDADKTEGIGDATKRVWCCHRSSSRNAERRGGAADS